MTFETNVPKVDPGEAVLAVVGIRPIISKEVERISAADMAGARDMAGKIERLASKLTRGELGGRVELGDEIDYDRMLRDLSEPPAPSQVEAMVASFPREEHEAAGAFLMAAGHAYDYLKQQFPISVSKGIGDSAPLPPATMLQARFESVLALVDKPLAVFDLLDTNALLGSQARALKACFPSIYSAILAALDARDAYERSRVASYVPHFAPALATLVGAPKVDPKTGAALKVAQAGRAASKAGSQQDQGPGAPGRQETPRENRTASLTAPPSGKLDGGGNAET